VFQFRDLAVRGLYRIAHVFYAVADRLNPEAPLKQGIERHDTEDGFDELGDRITDHDGFSGEDLHELMGDRSPVNTIPSPAPPPPEPLEGSLEARKLNRWG
jgi:hypothetical protein